MSDQYATSEEDNTQTSPAKVVLFSMSDPYAKHQQAVSQQQTKEGTQQATGEQLPATLTQTDLEGYWAAMFEPDQLATFSNPDKITSFLKDTTPQVGEDGKCVIITLTSSFAEYEVRKTLAEVMTHLRRSSGINDLSPQIVVKATEKAAMPYQSGEKYEAMLQINPALAELRKILPDIDI